MPKEILVQVGEFKTHCLRYLSELDEQHKSFIITKRGRPIAKVIPIQPKEPNSLFGYLKGTVTIIGDIVTPLDVEWEASKDE